MLQSKISKLVLWIAVFAVIGFADASFVALKNLRGETVPCSILKGCDTVLQSEYSRLFGQPVALWGALYYGIIILLIAVFLVRQRKDILKSIVLLTALGSIMSVYFLFLQFFIIKAVCLYCLVSAICFFSLFALSVIATRTISISDK